MNSSGKISFVVTTHYSKDINPNGKENIINYIRSLNESIKRDFELFIMDNSSDEKLNIPELDWENVHYFYIEDQSKYGLTGAWNKGIKKAYDANSFIIMNTNDDIIFNDTINDFIEIIENHPNNDVGLYGPVTDREGLSTDHQAAKKSENKIEETTGKYALNGFCYGFTSRFFEKFNENGNLFTTNPQKKWGGQEEELFKRAGKKGMRSFIVKNCYIEHKKHRTWMKGKKWIKK